jgi:hypothetical protein
MSRSIVGSLFGPTPEQLQRERMQQQAILSQNASRVSPSFGIGYNVGTMLGQGLGALFGVKDPELERATGVRKILQDTQSQLGVEAQDPALLFTTLQERLSDAGFGEEATLAAQQAQEARMRQAQIARQEEQGALYKAQALKALREDDPQQQLFFKLAENASPQSVATALANGMDIAMLDSPEKTQYSPLARQLIDAGFKYGSPEFTQKMNEGITADIAGKKRGSATEVNIRLGAQEKGLEAYGKKVGESVAEADVNLINRAETAPETISKLNATLAKINDPNAITGILSGVQTDVQRVISTLGGKEAAKKVEATQVLDALLGSEVFGQIQALGIGARGMDTPAERDFIRNVISGTTQLNASSLAEMVKIRKNIEKRMIQRYNKKLQSGDLDNFQEFSGRTLRPIFDENSIEINGVMFEVPAGLTPAQREFFIKKAKEKGAK